MIFVGETYISLKTQRSFSSMTRCLISQWYLCGCLGAELARENLPNAAGM